MYIEELEALKSKLKGIVEIKESTFSRLGLKISNIGFSDFNDDGWFSVIFEIESENQLLKNVVIKANFYDVVNNIIANVEDYVFADSFSGYDTKSIFVAKYGLSFDTERIMIFATLA